MSGSLRIKSNVATNITRLQKNMAVLENFSSPCPCKNSAPALIVSPAISFYNITQSHIFFQVPSLPPFFARLGWILWHSYLNDLFLKSEIHDSTGISFT